MHAIQFPRAPIRAPSAEMNYSVSESFHPDALSRDELFDERDDADMAFFRNHDKVALEVGARRGPLKYIEFSGVNRVALYDLGKDPGEQDNLLPFREAAAPEIETLRHSMKELLDRWIEAGSGTGDDFNPSLSGADSLDADTIEALRAIGYFGN